MEQNQPLLIDFMLRHAWHRVSRMYNNTASTEGMTMSVGFILMIVEKSGTPSTQLGPKMGMEPTSLSRTLNNMETSGLIERKEYTGDKRKVNIFLTTKGVEKRKLVRNFLLEFNERIASKFNDKDLKGFMNVMNAVDMAIEDVENTKNNE